MTKVINLFNKEEINPDDLARPVNEQFKEAVGELEEWPSLDNFIILAVAESGDMFIRSSSMSRKDAFWLLELAKDHAKYGEDE